MNMCSVAAIVVRRNKVPENYIIFVLSEILERSVVKALGRLILLLFGIGL